MYTHSMKLTKELQSGIVFAFFSSPTATYSNRSISHSDSETPLPTLYLITNEQLVVCKPTEEKEPGIPSPRQFHKLLLSYQVYKTLSLSSFCFYSKGIHLHADEIVLSSFFMESSNLTFWDIESELSYSKQCDFCELAKVDDNTSSFI